MNKIKFNLEKRVLLLIIGLSVLLLTLRTHSAGYGNPYYAATVKSMLTNWHNFFFASYDPAGFVSVDKPPLGLWLQTLSAFIFGFRGWSLLLPQALASVISILLIYFLVRKPFGGTAGLLSAFILATTPIFVAVGRTNELDPLLVMVILLAALTIQSAAEKGSFRQLLLAMILVGIGFNIKMLEAYLVLPAFYLIYLHSASLEMGKKVWHVFLATFLLIIVSLSWVLIVDLTPAKYRPYVGGSINNSELELAFIYNGVERILPNGYKLNGSGFSNKEGGKPGPFRLLNKKMAGQISWLFPLALLGFLIAMVRLKKITVPMLTSGQRNFRERSLIFWAAWITPMIGYFSIAGFFHRFYLGALAPGIAALAGIGTVELWRSFHEKGWLSWMVPVALSLTAFLQLFILINYRQWIGFIALLVFGIHLFIISRLLDVKIKKKSTQPVFNALIVGFATLMLTPLLWTATPILYGDEMVSPVTGPGLRSLTVKNLNKQMNMAKLIYYLRSNQKKEQFLVAVHSAKYASPIIIATGKPVMAMGGYAGRDAILAVAQLKNLVHANKVRYFLIPETTRHVLVTAKLDRWIKENGKQIPQELWLDEYHSNNLQLYDCKPNSSNRPAKSNLIPQAG